MPDKRSSIEGVQNNIYVQRTLLAAISAAVDESSPGAPVANIDARSVFDHYNFWFNPDREAQVVRGDLEFLADGFSFFRKGEDGLIPQYLIDLRAALAVIDRERLIPSVRERRKDPTMKRILNYAREVVSSPPNGAIQ